MGTPVEQQNLSKPFFVLALLIAACTAWAFYEEWVGRRPWKQYQREAFALERDKALADWRDFGDRLDAGVVTVPDPERPGQTLSLSAAQRRLGELEAARKPDDATAVQKLSSVEAEVDELEARVRLLRSEDDALFSRVRELLHARANALDEAKTTARAELARGKAASLARAQEQLERRRAELGTELEEAQGRLEAARERLGQLREERRHADGPRARLAAALAAATEPLERSSAQAKAAADREPVLTQYWLTTYDSSVDRCQNCHALIDRCGFSRPHELLGALGVPGANEDRVAAAYCVTRETLARYQATARVLCGPSWQPRGQAAAACLDEALAFRLTALLRDYCGRSPASPAACGPEVAVAEVSALLLPSQHASLYVVPVWAQSHPYRSQLLGDAHRPEQVGCTSCHEGQGAQTKGTAGRGFAHGHDDPYWERPLLDLTSVRRHRPETFGPPPPGQSVPGEWVSARHLVQSSCAKCHPDDVELEHAPVYSRGRSLFVELGCHGCHPLAALAHTPKIGPPLDDLRQRTSADYLTSWLGNPRAQLSGTRMPNFWPEALGVDGAPRPASPEHARREAEVERIAAHLWSLASRKSLPAAPPGDAKRGEALANGLGCRGCHVFVEPEKVCGDGPGPCAAQRTLAGSVRRDFAPNLSNVGQRASPAWLYAFVRDPASLHPGTRMPSLRLSSSEAADLTAYLVGLRRGPAPASTPRLAALFADEGSAEFRRLADEGGRLVAKLGCAGCHDLPGHEEEQKVGVELDEFGRKPADQFDFGNALTNPAHLGWYSFVDLKLRAPRAVAYERVEARMPQYDLDDAEIAALMTFLRSRTRDEVPAGLTTRRSERYTFAAQGDQLLERYYCRGCHVVERRSGALREALARGVDPLAGHTPFGGRIRELWTGDDAWKAPPLLQQEGFRVQPGWLFTYLKDPSVRLRPWLEVRMPTFAFSDDEAVTLVRGFAAQAGQSYPYLSAAPAALSQGELAQTQKLFDELRCQSCHVQGPSDPSRDPATLAPALELAASRLRPAWLRAWLADPQALQEGTRMPSYFTPEDPGAVLYPQHWNGSQERQIRALTDHVMSLGRERPRPLPKPAR